MNASANTQVIRPAGAGHETLYVLLFCLIVLACAGSVVFWHRESQDVASLETFQIDARRDLTPGEQGIYADLRVTLDEIRLLQQERPTLPTPDALGAEGFAPFSEDASSVSRGGHVWQLLDQRAYLGLSKVATTAGSFLLRVNAADPQPDIWLNRAVAPAIPDDLGDQALIAGGWRQIVAQFDAGVTRQHQH